MFVNKLWRVFSSIERFGYFLGGLLNIHFRVLTALKFWRCHKNNADFAIKSHNNKRKFQWEILTRLNPNNSFWTLSLSADGWWPLPMMNLSILAFFSSMMGCCFFDDTFDTTHFSKSVSSNYSNENFGNCLWAALLRNHTFPSSSFLSLGTSFFVLWQLRHFWKTFKASLKLTLRIVRPARVL